MKKAEPFEIQIICNLLYELDSSECFELMMRKNTRSCTHWKLVITSYNSHVYKTLCFYGSLMRSIQSCQINTTAWWQFEFQKVKSFLYTLYICG